VANALTIGSVMSGIITAAPFNDVFVATRNSQFTTLKSTPWISLSFFGTEQLPPWPEPD